MWALKCGVGLSIVFVVLFGVFTHSFLNRLRYRLVLPPAVPPPPDHSNDDDQRPPAPVFKRPPGTEHLDCARLFDQQEAQIYAENRLTYRDPPLPDDLPTDCRSIHARNFFEQRPLHAEEREFPIAFVRVVYRDYLLLESELAVHYAPQNTYFFVLDSKASKTFNARIHALAACFPNVFVARRAFDLDSAGKNMNYAFMEALRLLDRFEWKYVVLLQNHDIQIKTNEELVRIFTWMNGTNDVSAIAAPQKRIQPGINWSFKSLRLFKNQTRNTRPHRQRPPILQFAKSLVQTSLSRAAVEFLLHELNLERLLEALEWETYGTDELLFSTLNAHDAVDMPGGFTLQCLKKGIDVGSFTRLSLWHRSTRCHSKVFRHRICIFGMEDLLPLMDSPFLFANKMLPAEDFGALVCWHEWMFNRTHLKRGTFRLDRTAYLEAPQVSFNRERWEKGEDFRSVNFQCNA